MPRRQSKFLFACARLTRKTTNRNPKTDSTLRFRPLDVHSPGGNVPTFNGLLRLDSGVLRGAEPPRVAPRG